jgi:hypothetical protein
MSRVKQRNDGNNNNNNNNVRDMSLLVRYVPVGIAVEFYIAF